MKKFFITLLLCSSLFSVNAVADNAGIGSDIQDWGVVVDGKLLVKVTLDEYIEISKYYSGPGSSVFINGVLDKLVAALTEEGKIQKTGRGLI